MAIIGLKDLHYAIITSEDKEATVYGEVKPLGPAMALNLEPSVNTENLDADDGVLFSESSKGATSVELNTAYLEEEVEADILGKKLDENGGILDSSDDRAPYIAIAGKSESARGGYEYFWIYRVKLSGGSENKETKGDTPDYKTPNLSGDALPRINDKKERYKIWEKSENVTDPTIFDEWFNDVIDDEWVPGV